MLNLNGQEEMVDIETMDAALDFIFDNNFVGTIDEKNEEEVKGALKTIFPSLTDGQIELIYRTHIESI